jgi:tetratricopeptide (TPR) repeat protein
MISLMLDVAAGGSADNLVPFHRTSLILHVLNTALAAVLLYQLFGRPWVACGAALLFGVHPLVVEPIAWVGERKTLVAAFFSLICLVAYVRFARKGGRFGYAVTAILYALALMSKPTSTALPVVMLLLDFWPLGRFGRKAVIEKIPLFLIGGISAVITFVSQANTSYVAPPQQYGGLARIPLVFAYNTGFYLHKMLWPVSLSPHYAFPEPFSLDNASVRMYAIIGIGVVMFVAATSLWTRAILTGWLIFFVAVLPTMQVLQFSDVVASDKFVYLPSIGVVIVLGWALSKAWNIAARDASVTGKVVVMLVITAIAAHEGAVARDQTRYWADTIKLCERMIQVTPWSVSPREHMAIAMVVQGNLDGALRELERVYQMKPNRPQTMHVMGTVLANMGRLDEALEWHRKAAISSPLMYGPQFNAGVTLMRLGRPSEAVPYFLRAVALRPEWPNARIQLGIALAKTGDEAGAIAALRKAIEIDPDHRGAHLELAGLYVAQQNWDAAVEHYRRAVELKSDYESLINLGSALVNAGRSREAQHYYRQAIALQPRRALAYFNLAVVLAKDGRVSEAIALLQRVAEIEPENEQAAKYLQILTSGEQNGQ